MTNICFIKLQLIYLKPIYTIKKTKSRFEIHQTGYS